MIYDIKDKNLEVVNEIPEFEDLIFMRFSHFGKSNCKKSSNYLKFLKDKVVIKVDDEEIVLKSKVIKTDIYVIINNVISKIINDNNNIYIHSTVVSKNGKGILILGDFGSGKTTLSNEFCNYGYEINSTDQTWITKDKNQISLRLGSKFYVENNKNMLLNVKNEKVYIIKIIVIKGMAENGKVSIDIQLNALRKIKQIFSYTNWSYSELLFTDNINLFNTKNYMFNFLKEITDIELINVRGDKRQIIEKILK